MREDWEKRYGGAVGMHEHSDERIKADILQIGKETRKRRSSDKREEERRMKRLRDERTRAQRHRRARAREKRKKKKKAGINDTPGIMCRRNGSSPVNDSDCGDDRQ